MNGNGRNFIILKILDQIQQDNEDARDGINKSVVKIYNEEGISFEPIFHILYFDAVFINNK